MATKKTAAKKPPTKSEIMRELSERTDLPRKKVGEVFDELNAMIQKNLKRNGPGQFTIPGLCKIVVKKKPATKAHTKPDPFRPGETMQVKAKPASNQVKVRPLKGLKDMA